MIETTAELISNALGESDEHRYWNIIAELHKRGSLIEFDAAKVLSIDIDPTKRKLAANILGQLDHGQKAFQSESVALLIKLLDDPDEAVIYLAACSLGYRNDIAAVSFLIPLITHKNTDIRFGVTLGLSRIEDESAISALIKLSHDVDSGVRDGPRLV